MREGNRLARFGVTALIALLTLGAILASQHILLRNHYSYAYSLNYHNDYTHQDPRSWLRWIIHNTYLHPRNPWNGGIPGLPGSPGIPGLPPVMPGRTVGMGGPVVQGPVVAYPYSGSGGETNGADGQDANGADGQDANGTPTTGVNAIGSNGGVGGPGGAGGVGGNGGTNCVGTC